MKKTFDWRGLLYVVGILAFFVGAIDPLEGSVLIVAGSFLITVYKFLRGDRHKKAFLTAFLMITIGVAYMFWISSLGGIGANAKSWWWIIPVVPYPVGWLLTAILLYLHANLKWKLRKKTE